MTDSVYDFDALIAGGTRYVTEDGTGTDWITLQTIRTINQTAIDGGNYAVRIFLTTTTYQEGYAYGEVMQTDPVQYIWVQFTGRIENIQGANGRELYSGNSSANIIYGDWGDAAGGDDVISGLGGNDTLFGMGGSDRVNGDDGNDLLFGDADAAAQGVFNIAQGDDTLAGGAGDDTLFGGFGSNNLDGGAGFDSTSYQDYVYNGDVTYFLDLDLTQNRALLYATDLRDGINYLSANDTVQNIERFIGTAEADSMRASNGFTLGDQVRLTFEGAGGADTLLGGNGAEALYGGAGDDVLDSGLNGNVDYIADLLMGGTGNDTYHLHSAAEVVELWAEGTDTVISDFAYTLGYNLENLVLSDAAGSGSAYGNVLDNRLTGNGFANYLDGRGGLNMLIGGAGDDTYVVHANAYLNILDGIIELVGEGNDTVLSETSLWLSSFDNVENLVLTGSADSAGGGNALRNLITGNSGMNRLNSRGEYDTLQGGAGNDTYVISDANTVAVEIAGGGVDTAEIYVNYTLAAEIENLKANIGGLKGTGNALNNQMTGGSGADWLLGQSGNDSLYGGMGNDTLQAGDGNDALRGDLGNDVLNGGTGLDTANYGSANAIHLDLALAGAQNTGLGFDQLAAIENVLTGNGADVLRGNILANVLTSGGGDDDLYGGAGNDSLYAGNGNDILRGDLGDDVLNGGAGRDTLIFSGATPVRVDLRVTKAQDTGYGKDVIIGIEDVTGGSGADMVTGNALGNLLSGMAGQDTLSGGAEADLLIGGTGNDSLTGGADADMFIFGNADGRDVISDFQDGIDVLVMGLYTDVTVQDAGLDTLLIYGTTRVTLQNFDHNLISAADFLVP